MLCRAIVQLGKSKCESFGMGDEKAIALLSMLELSLFDVTADVHFLGKFGYA